MKKMFRSLGSSLKGAKNKLRTTALRVQFYSLHVVELPNGIRVATKESPIPLACHSLFVKTGSRFENADNNGISHFIEHMAYQGFNSIPKYNLQESLYSYGAKLSVHTTREYQIFTAVSPAEYASECVDVLSKIITSLELSDADIELQKKAVFTEAIHNDNNPKLTVFDYLHKAAFQETTLGQNVVGQSSNVAKFEKNFVRDFINNNYQPHRLLFVSTGGVSHTENISRINSCLGDLISNGCKALEYGPQRYTGSSIIYRNDSMPLAHVAIAVEAPGYDSPEYLPLFVASCLTGSWDRTQGGNNRHGFPLVRAAATSMLCEMFESFYIAYGDIGLWGVYFVSNSKGLDDMVYNIQTQWMRMCTTTSKSDVQRAVNLAKLRLAKQCNGLIHSCNDIGLQLFYTSNWKTLPEVYDDMDNITDKLIRKIGYKYIYDKCPVVAAVGPTETLSDYNRVRSGMYWLRI